VYFDINGCLVHFFHSAFTKLASETGKGAEAIETAFWHYNDAACRGEMTLDEFNTQFSEKLEIPKIDWKKYYTEGVESVPGMSELVQLASESYHVGLLSNIMAGLIDGLREKGLVPNINYSAIIDSSQVGAVKPEAKIYEIAQTQSGVSANEILLIDDSRANLMAADTMGWHVLWFDNYDPNESIQKIKNALEI
jgi:FMN phosphatase YigB (HAD superfamily)